MEFLTLPAEVRERIYHWVLFESGHTTKGLQPTYRSTHRGYAVPYKSGIDASLLLVNHQVHDEATRVLYRDHVFNFWGNNVLIEFLTRIGPRNASFISHIKLSGSYYDTYTKAFARAMELAPKLRRVNVDASLGPCSKSQAQRGQTEFLQAANSIIHGHPSLNILVSKYPGGLLLSSQGPKPNAILVSVVAAPEYKTKDGHKLDLDAEIDQLLQLLEEDENAVHLFSG